MGGGEVTEEGREEELMSKRLHAIGWTVVAVDFPLPLPIAHNYIVAMSRNAIHTWMNASGWMMVQLY